jgi:hypothetical protein
MAATQVCVHALNGMHAHAHPGPPPKWHYPGMLFLSNYTGNVFPGTAASSGQYASARAQHVHVLLWVYA